LNSNPYSYTAAKPYGGGAGISGGVGSLGGGAYGAAPSSKGNLGMGDGGYGRHNGSNF